MKRRSTSPEIHKFGGASLADAAGIRHAVSIVRGRRGTPLVVVVSALAGVSDALLELAARASQGDLSGANATADVLRRRHADATRALVPAGTRRKEILQLIATAFGEVEELVRGLAVLRELTPRTTDYVVARGERLSAQLFAAALRTIRRRAAYVEPLEIIKTDGHFGNAFPDLRQTDRAVRRVLAPLLARGAVPVVPGFIGATPDGQVATLGRGGTDFTATLLARALRSKEVSLWKDVPGLLTADPRVVPDARVLPQMNIREAAELAYYGAKVLHPRALIPIVDSRVAVRIRPFADPAAKGTEISRRRTLATFPVKALSAVSDQALITVTGNGMLGVPGIAARAFTALQTRGISVSLITQASSEHSISFSVPTGSAERARASLMEAFDHEIRWKEIDGVDVRPGVAMLAIVGLGMAGTPGVAARVFSAVSAVGINVIAIAQGSSELNISAVFDESDVGKAQRAVHDAFQLSKLGGGGVSQPERTDVVLYGLGQIGRPLAAMIAKVRHKTTTLKIVAVVDRSGFVFDARGLSASRIATLAAAKRKGTSLAEAVGGHAASGVEAVGFVAGHALSNPIFVDLTADETGDVLKMALGFGMNIVLANKHPITAEKERYDEILATAEMHGRRVLHETTVGAGLPIIDTYHKLVASGDRVYEIQGCPSGTLGFLFGELGREKRFSEALRGAIKKGYTEPDPREDLSGMDVARKALILGRLVGFSGELDDVAVESLVPPGAEDLPLKQFLRSLEQYDQAWGKRVQAARAHGGVLRYRAKVTPRKVTVGLLTVDPTSSMASLHGTDNQFIFTTMRYKTNPLVITGPGAGPAVTAGGILNDVLKLAGA